MSKLVDSEFIANLVANSYEVRWGAVSEAMEEHSDLFGGPDTQVIATFDHHVIAVDPEGSFYRARWDLQEDGEVQFSEVENLDIPVFEASDVTPHARDQAMTAVDAILSGDADSSQGALSELYGLVSQGAVLTAEGVEDEFNRQTSAEPEWHHAVTENEGTIRTFLGADATRLPVIKPCFESITGDEVDESESEPYREEVRSRLREMRSRMESLRDRLVLAREIDESYSARGSNDEMSVTEFVEFSQELAGDLDTTLGLVEDAISVSDDGCVKCLARVHDGIANDFTEWTLATAFAEKLARRFQPSQAA